MRYKEIYILSFYLNKKKSEANHKLPASDFCC